MADTIYRQTAIEALGERPLVWSDNDDYTLGARNQYDTDRLAIETVPSAQSECEDVSDTNVGKMCEYYDLCRNKKLREELLSAQPTLYGYDIKMLALVAEIMRKNDIGPEEALCIFRDNQKIAEMIRNEFHEILRKQVEQIFPGADVYIKDDDQHEG